MLALTLFTGFFGIESLSVKAEVNVLQQSGFGFKQTSVQQNESFAPANSIYIVPLSLGSNDFITDEQWYRGIQYYQSVRLNQGDFLFHYFVGKDGSVYQGNLHGEEYRFSFKENTDKPIVIGYLSGRDELDFNRSAKPNLSALVLEIANRNNIALDHIFVKDLVFIAKPDEAISARAGFLSGRWETSLKGLVKTIQPGYNPKPKQYKFEVSKVDLPKSEVNYGDSVVANITIKNTSGFIFYQGTERDPIIAKTSGDSSIFFVNNVWLSRTQAAFIKEDTILKPGDSATFSVRLSVPLYFGALSEDFQLTDTVGNVYPDTKFPIKLNVKHPDKAVVEITKTETGQLNVRNNPWGSAQVITRVTPGQRFFQLERSDSGWVKLDLGDKSGWVLSKYTKVI